MSNKGPVSACGCGETRERERIVLTVCDMHAAEARREAPPPLGRLQQFYNITTTLLSEAPHGIIEEGATQGYHDALLALTTFRDELRRYKHVTHDERFWKPERSALAGVSHPHEEPRS